MIPPPLFMRRMENIRSPNRSSVGRTTLRIIATNSPKTSGGSVFKLDSLSFQSLGKCCTVFGLRGVIAHILVLGILFLGYDRQCTGLDRYFLNLVLIHISINLS